MKNGLIENSYHVNLIVNLLVRFPEIFTINYNHANCSYCFTYMIQEELRGQNYQNICRHLEENMKAFHFLQKKVHMKLNIRKKTFHGLTQLEILFPAEPLSSDEVSMVTRLLKEQFSENIISELRPEDLDLDENGSWEEFMEYLLFQGDPKEENLFAFRESGKVYVFDK